MIFQFVAANNLEDEFLMQAILRDGHMTILKARGSTPVYRNRKEHQIFHGSNDLITI